MNQHERWIAWFSEETVVVCIRFGNTEFLWFTQQSRMFSTWKGNHFRWKVGDTIGKPTITQLNQGCHHHNGDFLPPKPNVFIQNWLPKEETSHGTFRVLWIFSKKSHGCHGSLGIKQWLLGTDEAFCTWCFGSQHVQNGEFYPADFTSVAEKGVAGYLAILSSILFQTTTIHVNLIKTDIVVQSLSLRRSFAAPVRHTLWTCCGAYQCNSEKIPTHSGENEPNHHVLLHKGSTVDLGFIQRSE